MFKNLVTSLFLLLFIGCGTSGGGGSPVPTIDVNGQLIDGYIKNATVCLDLNLNALRDSDEKTTLSDDNGTFKFGKIVKSDKFVSLISIGGIDTISHKEFEGQIKTIINLNDSGKSLVTPITDMIASAFISSTNKNIDTLKDIEIKLANNLNLDISKLHNDPMKDKVVFAKAQEIVSFKAFVKNLSKSNNDKAISEVVSNTFLNKTINEDVNLTIALGKMDATVNNDTIIYTQNEYSYLKQSIEDTIVNNDIDISKIDRYQRMIQESTRLVKAHIVNNNYEYIVQRVQIIDIDDTAPIVKNNIDDKRVDEDGDDIIIDIRDIFTDEDNNDSLITKDILSLKLIYHNLIHLL
jgi:hypothetical protein